LNGKRLGPPSEIYSTIAQRGFQSLDIRNTEAIQACAVAAVDAVIYVPASFTEAFGEAAIAPFLKKTHFQTVKLVEN